MAAYLNDFGVLCALGNDKESVVKALLTNTEHEYLEASTTLSTEDKTVYVGKVTANLPETASWPAHFKSRNNQLAWAAYLQIEASFSAISQDIAAERIAVVIGTSTSGIKEGEQMRRDALSGNVSADYHYHKQEMIAPAKFLAVKLNAKGPIYSISTACSSSAKALATARMILEADLADVVICGGVDSLSQLTINGFDALESLSDNLCQPFSQNRDGINIGEAAALFVMSKQRSKLALVGVGECSDAYHVSAPHPEGEGAFTAMNTALSQAGLSASDIDYINLHGTGTPKNDEMEAKAVNRLFSGQTLASSTKRFTGHTLGAAGALEAGLCYLMLSDLNVTKSVAVNKGCQQLDGDLASIRLVDHNTQHGLNYCLSNSFAFGGSNISLLIGRMPNE